ncbi:TetR family transcriptional regulator [Streptomyces sp. P6-2-1]|uniref:TetR family transcriptional regulator n=1 Tax=unclassified Streptomyces TaxID=2593676 RepID=UPI003D36BD25
MLEAAAGLFATRGYAATSINDISARSGRTSGAVYFHYTNKEGVALAVVRDRFADWGHLRSRYTARDVCPLENLVALSFTIAGSLADDPVARAGARLWAERATIAAPLPDPFGAWTFAATRLLARARHGGTLSPGVSPARTAPALVRAFYGVSVLTAPLAGDEGFGAGAGVGRRRGQIVGERLYEWWRLVLPALYGRRGDPGLLERAARAATEPEHPLAEHA